MHIVPFDSARHLIGFRFLFKKTTSSYVYTSSFQLSHTFKNYSITSNVETDYAVSTKLPFEVVDAFFSPNAIGLPGKYNSISEALESATHKYLKGNKTPKDDMSLALTLVLESTNQSLTVSIPVVEKPTHAPVIEITQTAVDDCRFILEKKEKGFFAKGTEFTYNNIPLVLDGPLIPIANARAYMKDGVSVKLDFVYFAALDDTGAVAPTNRMINSLNTYFEVDDRPICLIFCLQINGNLVYLWQKLDLFKTLGINLSDFHVSSEVACNYISRSMVFALPKDSWTDSVIEHLIKQNKLRFGDVFTYEDKIILGLHVSEAEGSKRFINNVYLNGGYLLSETSFNWEPVGRKFYDV